MKNKLVLIAYLEKVLPSFLSQLNQNTSPHLLLALSGGIDSVVLLHALNSLKHTAEFISNFPFSLSAIHIHHGLNPNANQWQRSCKEQCQQWKIPFYFQQVHVDPYSGLGIEATARKVRYEALSEAKLALKADCLVLAHHQQDQAETFLLQLLRGAGVKGLSSMPYFDHMRGLYRPMVNQITKHDILEYAQAQELSWVEDDSNQNIHFDRNYVRHQLIPVLETRYQQAQQSIARSASHMAEAQDLLDDLAKIDLQACQPSPVWMGQSIQLSPLKKLSERRAKNAIRYWLAQQQLLMPNQEQLHIYWQQLAQVKETHNLKLGLKHQHTDQLFYLQHYQGVLYCEKKAKPLPNTTLCWQGEPSIEWGNGWHLEARLEKGKGIALNKIGLLRDSQNTSEQQIVLFENTSVMLHPRAGGEMLQPEAKRPRRELKVLFQQAHIPPWQRSYHPLLSVQNKSSISDNLSFLQNPPNQQHLVAMLPNFIDVVWQASKLQWGIVLSLHYSQSE